MINSSSLAPATGDRRVVLLCDNEMHKEQIIDALCIRARRQNRDCCVISLHGGLVSNISVAENLWLPVSWRDKLRGLEVLQEARRTMQQWGLETDRAETILSKRPAQLHDNEKRCVLLLRAALMRAPLLIFDGDFFAQAQTDDLQQFEQARDALEAADWYIVSEHHKARWPAADWQSMHATSWQEKTG